jgi:hypothetical protein
MCLLMFEDYFWQSGDFWNTPPDVEISIDHRPVANIAPRIEFYGGVGFPKNEYDDQGSLIGVHGNNFQYCFQPRLDYGEHVLKVEVLPPNRDSLVYYVLFRVE